MFTSDLLTCSPPPSYSAALVHTARSCFGGARKQLLATPGCFAQALPSPFLSTAPPATLSFAPLLAAELLGRRRNSPCLLTLCSIARARRLASPLRVS